MLVEIEGQDVQWIGRTLLAVRYEVQRIIAKSMLIVSDQVSEELVCLVVDSVPYRSGCEVERLRGPKEGQV